jgi:hypothetical protein
MVKSRLTSGMTSLFASPHDWTIRRGDKKTKKSRAPENLFMYSFVIVINTKNSISGINYAIL